MENNPIISKTYQSYSLEELAAHDPRINLIKKTLSPEQPLDRIVKDDDGLNSALWTEAYKMAGYYYDKPDETDRRNFLQKFRYNFSTLLQNLKNPQEIPNLNNRNNFLLWVCRRHNEYLSSQKSNEQVKCDLDVLRKTYAPDYKAIEQKFGRQLDLSF